MTLIKIKHKQYDTKIFTYQNTLAIVGDDINHTANKGSELGHDGETDCADARQGTGVIPFCTPWTITFYEHLDEKFPDFYYSFGCPLGKGAQLSPSIHPISDLRAIRQRCTHTLPINKIVYCFNALQYNNKN